jgi:signal transduction histidine kinase
MAQPSGWEIQVHSGSVGRDVNELLTPDSRRIARARLNASSSEELSPAAGGLLATPGEEFFRWLTQYLQSVTGTAYAFVGEVVGAEQDRVKTVAVSHNGSLIPNFEYDLRGTPCANVLHQDVCAHPAGVAAIYPDDLMLTQMGIDAYVGLSLTDASGAPLGLAVVLDTQPMSDHQLAVVATTLELLRGRTAAELRHRAALWHLETAVAGTAGETLDVLLRSFADALLLKGAFVGRYDPKGRLLYPLAYYDGVSVRGGHAEAEDEAARLVREGGELLRSSIEPELLPTWLRGDPFHVESYCAVAVRNRKGQVTGLIGLIHDRPMQENLPGNPLFRLFRSRIAAEVLRWEAEEQQQALQRSLMAAQRRTGLGMMAGGIAHDFNNLLMTILGNTELLLLDAKEDDLREGLDAIMEGALQASELCGQLLAYAGQGPSSKQSVDLNDVVSSARKVCGFLLPNTCKMAVCPAQSPARILADPVQIKQVLVNLIKNAGEAIGSTPGVVSVKVTLVDCQSELFTAAAVGGEVSPGPYCCLTVSDNGSGMPPEVLENVLEPFFSTKAEGHGLGLAAVSGIIMRHKGALVVNSDPGRGTDFRIYIPQHIEQSDSEHPHIPALLQQA